MQLDGAILGWIPSLPGRVVMAVVRLRQTTTHVTAPYATPRQPRLMPRPLLVSPRIQAGFPSPAADYIEE